LLKAKLQPKQLRQRQLYKVSILNIAVLHAIFREDTPSSLFYCDDFVMIKKTVLFTLILCYSPCNAMNYCTPGALVDVMNRVDNFFISLLNPDLLQQRSVIEIKGSQQECEKECYICFEEYTYETVLGKLPCDHYCCYQCMADWFTNNITCPYCRREFQSTQIIKCNCILRGDCNNHEN